ncbi:hypothetical protein CC80DRAFT_496787 [Byssothecium circinans]|uniref:RING-type domain-containing protein n=1 Tax=Byssothecium circinans TaxID=147558 RepID=A0A6A5TCN9_9PLEO|nr:hypothetical protein CC80DRAFT_496787 [Byssothecium circinans]
MKKNEKQQTPSTQPELHSDRQTQADTVHTMPRAANKATFHAHHLNHRSPKTLPRGSVCPICIEPYSDSKRPVQIYNIDNCTHVFCAACMSEYTTEHHPHNGKTCPLCRVEWYPDSRRAGRWCSTWVV